MAEDNDDYRFIGPLWDRIKAFFAAMWEGVWGTFTEIWPTLVDKVFWLFRKGVMESDDKAWDFFLDAMLKQEVMNQEQVNYFKQYKGLPVIPGFPLLMVVMMITLSLHLKAVIGPMSTIQEQKTNESQRPNLADPSSLIKSAFIAPEKTVEIRGILAKYGFSDQQMEYLFLSNYSLYDMYTCRDLFLRGVLSNEQLFERMRELGFTDTRTKEIMQTWEIIPGPSDLFHLVAKEAFEPEMISKMGLDDEFPEEQTKWLKMQGLSEDWARKYWYAHWEMPSIQMGFEMLHRDVIDYDGLDMLFRSIEIPPFWRDKLTQIAFHPYTRVDTRRMYNFDVLNLQDVYDSYKHQGYDHEHALKMTEWTAAQKDPINKDISMGQILSTYEDQVLERNDAISLLQDIGYTEQKAEFLLTAREFEMAQKIEKKQISITATKFINRYIDKFEALRQLSLLNLPYKQQNLLMQEWELDLMQDNKLPSKTDLEKFFLEGIINEEIYKNEMHKLGYNQIYAGWYRQLIESKRKG